MPLDDDYYYYFSVCDFIQRPRIATTTKIFQQKVIFANKTCIFNSRLSLQASNTLHALLGATV
jgi:hypothetical protein